MKWMNSIVALFSLPMLGMLAGCASDGVFRSSMDNRCVDDADCPGARCDRVQHICVAADARTEVVFFARPPETRTSNDAVATVLEPRTVQSNAGEVQIQLQHPQRVIGIVQAPRLDPTTQRLRTVPIAARLRFRRHGSIAALEPPVEVQTSIEPRTETIAGRDYTFTYSAPRLIPGDYDVTVIPATNTDAALSPPFYDVAQVRVDETGAPTVLEYTYPTHLAHLSGVVQDETGAPVAGLTVRCVDVARGGATISTSVVTKADGAFDLLLAPNRPGLQPGMSDDWLLELSTELDRTSGVASEPYRSNSRLVSRMVFRASRASLGASTIYTGITVRLPARRGFTPLLAGATRAEVCTDCVLVQQRIEGSDSAGQTIALPGTQVELRNDLVLGPLPEGQSAWFEAQVTTDSAGDFEAALPPGTYRAIVTPADDRFAITRRTLEVGDPSGGAQQMAREQRGAVLTVEGRATVAGLVTNALRNTPMGDVVIEAVPFPSAPTEACPSADRPARSNQVRSNAQGGFGLPLDPGQYRLIARPAPGSGFAVTVYAPSVCVTEGSAQVTLAEPVALVSPLAVQGRVVLGGTSQDPIANAEVRAFARLRSGSTPLDIEIAHATADASGRFSFLVPSFTP